MTSPGSTGPRGALVLKALAATAVGIAWLVLGRGLLAGPHDARAWDDLEAGGRFALNLTHYLPYLLLSVAVALVVVAGLLPRAWPLGSLALTVVLVVLADAYGMSSGVLRDAQPQLAVSCLVSLGVAGVAGALVAGAWALRAAEQPAGALRP